MPRKHTRKERLAGWYMVRIAGRYCPCQWPIKSRRLIRLCGRIDDYFCDRAKLLDAAHFYTYLGAEASPTPERTP